MSNAQNDFAEKMYQSKLKYISTLPAKISEINLTWNQLHNNDWHTEVLLKMRGLVHNLAGAGGTFGFPQLSDRAHALEQELNSIHTIDSRPDQEHINKIQSLLSDLQSLEIAAIRSVPDEAPIVNNADLIYILDDDQGAANDLSRHLRYFGWNVKTINSTLNIEDQLKSASPLMILIDEHFANLYVGTRTVIQAIRKNWLITCPIVYISQNDDFNSRVAATKATASAYFTKPVDIPLLIERIHILTNAGNVEPYRVLIVEDDEELADFYALELRKHGLHVFIETKPELALNRILQVNPELVVMDLYMPNYNGIDLIKVIRQHQSLFTLPIVLLTAEQDVDLQFLAREEGVDDFLQKPISEMHLLEAVLNRVQRSRYMNISMTKDSLTGLFVHKKINEFLEINLKLAQRYNHSLSYAIIDIDNFKLVNDTYGHLVGDDILVALANLLKASVRSTDFVGRYGGEEFVVIAPETDAESMLASIDRMRREFANLKHFCGDKEFNVTFSAGIASFPKFKELDIIMDEADKALYTSKHNGRNRITIA